jgi:hypothetical protein
MAGVEAMFVLALTSFGVSQRLLTYSRMSDALARAAMTPSTEADKAQIYKVPSVDDKHADPSIAGLSRGVFVGAVDNTQLDPIEEARGAQTAKAQLLAAMAPVMLNEE